MAEKLTKSQREKIIFNHLKGIEDPLYEVSQTKFGKWIVKAKPIEVEEEEVKESEPVKKPKLRTSRKSNNDEEIDESYSDDESSSDEEEEEEVIKHKYKSQKMNRKRAKQDAKRILDVLTNLINSNNGSDSSDDEQQHQVVL